MNANLSTELSTAAPHNDARVLKVTIDAPLRAPFDYLPPADLLADQVPLGARVRVPVGPRQVVGIVIGRSAHAAVPEHTLRRAAQLLDPAGLVEAPLLQLLQWTADYYHHPLGEVIAAALPKALRRGATSERTEAAWRLTAEGQAAFVGAQRPQAPAQRAMLAALAAAGSGMRASQLPDPVPSSRRALRALAARGWVEVFDSSATAPSDPVRFPDMPVAADASTAVEPPRQLSAEQAAAVDSICAAADRYGTFVLQGATGSGKTEVYLRCAADTLARGLGVLVLVPEIALTPQVVERFRRQLATPLAVLHSGLSDGERLAAWRLAHEGRARVVLGTRSAVFASLPRLGLIIVDEEHDSSYKQQEGGCRYNARDVAIVRAQHACIPIVLGSATPALETLQNVSTARYRSLRLPRRTDQAAAPLLRLVDLRAHSTRQGLSTPVVQAMRRHLAADRQVLVFINRRGYAPTLLCTACGWMAPCPHCDARLTVHRAQAQLSCHHCGATQPLPRQCLRCGHAVKPVGQGTERVEETLQELFPERPLLRLDRDTAARPEQLEHILQRLRSGEARILVGTQMVTKGHHFPSMMLAVVLNADQGLFSTDFRAPERLAQTIVQVAGRAGREREQGEVLIQTEYPEHPLLQNLLAGGYEGFATSALAERRAARWPPFVRLALLRASSSSSDGALRFLLAARARAPADVPVQLLGPVPAALARRAGRHYAQLLLESTERGALHRFIAAWLPQVDALARSGGVRYALDVDPLDIG